MSDLASLGATDMLDGYRSRAFGPVDAVEACLARMDAGASLGALVTRCDDRARTDAAESARRWAGGTARRLEGVPFVVKDIIETEGVFTEAGSPLHAGHIPATNATVVERMQAHGAVMVAKTTTPEFAFGDESGDGVANPWGASRWVGGSSSGSAAALASRQVPVALGTDTGGSIRVPASYCGVSGLKPTFGLVPRDGVFPVSWTLDHVGPMARNVEDLGLVLGCLAGQAPADPYSSSRDVPDYMGVLDNSLDRVRIGVPDGWLGDGCTASVLSARDNALAVLTDLGAEVLPISVPHAELAGTIAWLITVVEFSANHDDRLEHVEDFTPSAAQRLVAGASTSARDYLKALRGRNLVQRDFDDVFAQVDVIVTPATPTAGPDLATFFDDGDRLWLDKVARNFLIFNLTGMPALVLPSGLDDGMPTAIQIAAAPHADALCLHVGAAFQRATDHHLAAPAPG